MAIGYRVELGDGTLNSGDVILDGIRTFVPVEELGAGEWRWSGTQVDNGKERTDRKDDGTYYKGSDGHIYFVPDKEFADPLTSGSVESAPAYTAPSGPVDGTGGDDVIDGSYADAQGDEVTEGGNTINAGAGNDTVIAGAGADTIDGGSGNDTLDAGAGDDTVSGGTGNDTIYGGSGSDTITGGDGDDVIHADNASAVATDEVLHWLDEGTNGTDLTGGFTQTTGTMNVDVTIIDEGGLNRAEASSDTQYRDLGAGETFDRNSALQLGGNAATDDVSPTGTILFDFDPVAGGGMAREVQNVSFRVNDIDQGAWDDRVTVIAYDADGNQVPVTFQLDGDDSMLDADTIDGAGTGSSASQAGSALITIAGPVAQIAVIYENAGDGGQALWLTDMHFTTIPDDGQGDDVVSGGAGNDQIYGYGGDDQLDGGADDDTMDGGAGDDTITGGSGNDTMSGGAGDDTFIFRDGFGDDTVIGGEAGETLGDDIDASALTGDTTVTFSGAEAGTLNNGASSASFAEIESLTLGSGNDTVTGGAGDQIVDTGAGADTVSMGAGNDTVSLGASDGAVDTVIFSDGDGNDTVHEFEAPSDNGDGTYTGADQLDLSGLTNGSGRPVSVHDVVVSDDGSGSAVLSFPNGETLIMPGVSSAQASNPMFLMAMGVPGDGIVSGTAGNDTIDASYSDDPHGDMVDNGDAILPGESGDDDIIEAGDGDDTIYPGAGDDEVYGQGGDDTVILETGFGSDQIFGGETGEISGDTLSAGAIADDVTVSFSGAESGTLSDGTDTATFSEIENVVTGAGDDTITGNTGDQTVSTGAGSDSISLGAGADTISAGAGDDTIVLTNGFGDDVIAGGEGDETAGDLLDASALTSAANVTYSGDEAGTISQGGDTASFSEIEELHTGSGADSVNATAATGGVTLSTGAGNDSIALGSGDDTVDAGTGEDMVTISDGFGNDVLTGGEGGEGFFGDVLYGVAMTDNVVLTFTGDEAGTISDGTDTLTFAEFESVALGSGDDTVTGSASADQFDAGAGADTIEGGAGDDRIGLGTTGDFATPDGDADRLIFSDGDGNDIIHFFDAPTANGDGSFTGIDQIDVSGMTDAGGDPVSVFDVVVSNDGSGNAVLTFPGGESLTLVGVDPVAADDPNWLIAAGIPGDGIVSGTAGDDIIDASYAGDPHGDVVDGGDAFLPGEVGDDDIIEAGAGNDTIYGGAGDDEIFGEAGDDRTVLEDGFGADQITGGETGETAGDTLDATGLSGNATVTFSGDEAGTISDGTDTASFSEIERIETGAGDDTVDGSAASAAITADTGAGADTLTGGAGDDTLVGGAGNDTLTGGAGADRLEGGDDADVFYAGVGDVVLGGEGGVDADVLDLTDAGPTRVIYTEGDPESGTVEFLDGAGNVTGTMTFSEIETVNFIPCFTPGTMIATPQGPRPVEVLSPGDAVLTRDRGVKRLEWVGQRLLNGSQLAANPRLQPVRIRAGALGYGLPERDMIVSPQHKMLISDARAEMLFGEHEVLVAAVHLVGLPGIERVACDEITYVHVMFDAHEIIMAEGAWTESYQPGPHVLSEMEDEQREEIYDIFPELRAKPDAVVAARMALKKREAAALFA